MPNELPEGVAYKGIFAEEVAQANADVHAGAREAGRSRDSRAGAGGARACT